MNSSAPVEKLDAGSTQSHHDQKGGQILNGAEAEIERIDAIATDPAVTMETFAHLEEKRILAKMDIRLIPVLLILYLLAFLDRGNIGNAKIEGLAEDLRLTGNQYNICLTVFFLSYAVFELPSNLLLKKLRPSRWLPFIMVCWGTVMTLMGIVQNYSGLLAARFFLGIAEAGLYPGCAYYLTLWYCRHEIQYRQALFYSGASLAGAFSGLLAYAISKMDGVGGLEGWRWIFILEGLLTVIFAVVAFFLIFDFPETAGFLTDEERAFVVYRLKYGQKSSGKQIAEVEHFEWKYVKEVFLDWQIYIHLFLYWGVVCPTYGIALFLPTIVKSLGYVSSTAQLMTVPIYGTAAILSVVVAYLSDKAGKRSPFIICLMFVMLAGFTMCISSSDPHVVYGGIFIAACSISPCFPGIISWLSNNLAGSYKRSAGMAIQIGVGNFAGAMASNFYRAQDAPRFVLGHALEIGFIVVGIIAAFTLVFGYTASNKKRERALGQGGEVELPVTDEQLAEQGDKAVTFRYML